MLTTYLLLTYLLCSVMAQIFFELETKWNLTLLEWPGLCEAFPVFFLTTQHLGVLMSEISTRCCPCL